MAENPVVIIPARYGSSRLPAKALADIGVVPMIVRVYERACRIPGAATVLVATDDERIAAAVRGAGGEVVMTRADHPSGTDRIAEAARGLGTDIVVNVQGDLPFLDPRMVTAMVRRLEDDPGLAMSTVMTPTRTEEECDDPNVVKIVVGVSGDALYFSRRRIPAGGSPPAAASTDNAPRAIVMRHIGLYAYRRGFLDVFTRLGPTPLERTERLEQLRALEHGHRIGVALWEGAPMLEVNTPEELEAARRQAAEPARGRGETARRATSGPMAAADECRNATKPMVTGAAARGAR